ncbi:helix-turn-helix domain-containing protein [Sorangium sp. So ce367]|uniref:helix-turn-helix domain-containing protein n=1 Tax=Sorangium sp. So ce367 TaxID=3133305 RepID=UPI003F5F4756
MPYRELIMVDIKEMLRRRAAGQSARHVARETGVDRKTVGRYFEAAAMLPLPRDREPTDEEIHTIAQRVQARPVLDASEEWKEIGAHRARIEAWLAQPRPLKLAVWAGLDAAWWFFGAMARVILPDNMKAVVLRADELAPRARAGVPRLHADTRAVRGSCARQVAQGQGACREPDRVRARELVRRRVVLEPRRGARVCCAVVP